MKKMWGGSTPPLLLHKIYAGWTIAASAPGLSYYDLKGCASQSILLAR